MTKVPTQWIDGTLLSQTGIYFQDNLGNILITNLGGNFVPNPYYVIGKIATAWSLS